MSSIDPRIFEIALKRPEKFFKYTALDGERREWTHNLVVDSALFFARPSMFNDPLDCRIPPSFEAVRRTSSGSGETSGLAKGGPLGVRKSWTD